MANVKFNKKLFEKEIGNLTDEMQEKIAMFGMTVESVNEEEVELDITPDRPDLLSYYGFRRGFLAFIGKKVGLKEYKINNGDKNYEVKVDSSVKDVRPFTVCMIVKDLKLDDEKIKDLIDIQEKLHSTVGRKRKKLAIGIYPLSEIKLPINYKAIEPDKIKFQPLESSREMNGLEILQRHPTGKEYAHLLKGKIKFPIFIDSNENILSMPPIINSEKTGRVSKKTKEVFVECSGFDEEILNKCLNILVSVFSEMDGKIYSMKVGGKVTPEFKIEKIKLSVENTNKLLGLELKEKEIKELLRKMGHEYEKGEVKVAPYRVDILHEVDLIEDVAISYGYNNFEAIIPKISTIGEVSKEEIVKKRMAEILIGLRLLEVSNYHLTKKQDQFTKMGLNEKQEKGQVDLVESKTEYNILRKDLTHYLLKILSENSDAEYPQKIFEIGRVFNLDNFKKIIEEERLGFAITPGNFTDVRQVLDYLSSNLDLEFEVKEQEKVGNHFVEGRVANIFLDKEKIGEIGEIHPKILKNWKIKMPVALFEISVDKIVEKF